MESSSGSGLSSDKPQAGEAVRTLFGEQQQAAASGLGEFAGALRRAAHDSKGGGSVTRVAESAADQLQRFSESLQRSDFDSILRNAESFARRQPVAFIGAAAVAGFLAVRFLKSSSPASSSMETTARNSGMGPV
jgi:hypothetical protein